MKRKIVFLGFAFVLIGMLIVVGGKPAIGKPIELKMTTFQPPLHKSVEMLTNWGKLITKETGGKVKFTMFAGATLAKPKQTYQATVTGIADICWAFCGYTPGRFNLSEVVLQPLGFKNAEHGARVLWDLYQKYPEIGAQIKDTHLLWLGPAPHRQIHSKTAIRKVADLKGMKVRVPGTEAPHVKAMGGVPVSVPGPEVYLALERGIIDADFHPWETAYSYKWYEVAKYHIKADLYIAGVFICAMNLNTWNKLPADVQKVIDKYSGKYGWIEVCAKGMWDKYDKYYLEWLKKNTKNEIIYWSDAEKAKARKLMTKPVVDKWVAAAEAKGQPGKKLLADCIKLLKKYE